MTPFSDAQPLLFRASSAMMGAAFGFRRAFLGSAVEHAAFCGWSLSNFRACPRCARGRGVGAQYGTVYPLSAKLNLLGRVDFE